jgi:hypothetical protein
MSSADSRANSTVQTITTYFDAIKSVNTQYRCVPAPACALFLTYLLRLPTGLPGAAGLGSLAQASVAAASGGTRTRAGARSPHSGAHLGRTAALLRRRRRRCAAGCSAAFVARTVCALLPRLPVLLLAAARPSR